MACVNDLELNRGCSSRCVSGNKSGFFRCYTETEYWENSFTVEDWLYKREWR